MRRLSRPIRLLAFWPASDFEAYFEPAFLNRKDIDGLEVELVSGHRTSGPSPYAAKGHRLAQLKKRLLAREFDLVLCGNIWNNVWPPHKQLATQCAQAARFLTYKRGMLDTYWGPSFARIAARAGVPFATLDLRDPSTVYPWDLPLLREGFLYYKRELFYWPVRSLGPAIVHYGREVERLQDKLRPLSYGVHPGAIPEKIRPFAERDIDVFMSGMPQPLREKIAAQLEAMQGEFRIEVHREMIPREIYLDRLSRSRLVVCVESFGCETWRMYEASAAGAVPLVSWPYTQNLFPLEPDKHAIYFSYIGDHFQRQIRQALAQPEKLAEISRDTAVYTREVKDRRSLATWIIENTLEEFQAQR